MSQLIRSNSRAKDLISKFKSREQETGIEQALVFLKLKEHNCPTKQALIFSKKLQGRRRILTQPQQRMDLLIVGGLSHQNIKMESLSMVGQKDKNQSMTAQQVTNILSGARHNQYSHRSLVIISNHEFFKSTKERFAVSHCLITTLPVTPRQRYKRYSVIQINQDHIIERGVFKVTLNESICIQVEGIIVATDDKNILFLNVHNRFYWPCHKIRRFLKLCQQFAVFDLNYLFYRIDYVPTDDNNTIGNKSPKHIRNPSTQITILEKRNQILNYKKLLQQPKSTLLNRLNLNHPISPSKKVFKTLNNVTSQLLKPNSTNSLKLTRSKSALRRNQIKQFEDKISLIVKNQFSKTFSSSFKRAFEQKHERSTKLKLTI